MGEGGCVLVTFTSTANGYECNIDGLFFLVSFFFLVFFFFFFVLQKIRSYSWGTF